MKLKTNIHALMKETPPPFGSEKLISFSLKEYKDDLYYQSFIADGEVNLAKVKGTCHSDYYGYTWQELLPSNPDDYLHLDKSKRHTHQGKMKRGWNCIYDMRENPNYYLENCPKDNWSFYKMGENYYISEGNHRTVIARFLLSLNGYPEIIRGIPVIELRSIQKSKSSDNSKQLTSLVIEKLKNWFSTQH